MYAIKNSKNQFLCQFQNSDKKRFQSKAKGILLFRTKGDAEDELNTQWPEVIKLGKYSIVEID